MKCCLQLSAVYVRQNLDLNSRPHDRSLELTTCTRPRFRSYQTGQFDFDITSARQKTVVLSV